MLRRLFDLFWHVLESTTMAMAFVVVTYLFFFQPGVVKGNSSYPTWKEEERFISEKVSYKFGSPQRGDFIVVESPQNSEIDFIKRVVGLPNETLSIKDCQVYINGERLVESYLQPGTCTAPNGKFVIPDDYYFLMGDNRTGSSDSRSFGPRPQSTIVAKVLFRYWPLDRVGSIL